MEIQQAIFTSSDRGRIKGYQLVAKSNDIDQILEKVLHRWSPSQIGQADPAHWTINYFPVSDDLVAVARTVLGGPEYSSRGEAQVVTLIAVLDNEQFAAYDNNAMLVAQTALALGYLRLPADIPVRLETLRLPASPFTSDVNCQGLLGMRPVDNDWPIGDSPRVDLENEDALASMFAEIAQLVASRKRLAIIGDSCPLQTVSKLIAKLSVEQRRAFSFTTGLPPALHRPFQLHFLPHSNPALKQMLESEGITIVSAPQLSSKEW